LWYFFEMTKENYDKFFDIDYMFHKVYKYINPEEVISKPHYLDKYLAFGFRKEDVTLRSFVDYSEHRGLGVVGTRKTYHDISTFNWWMKEYVAPYISHGEVIKKIEISHNASLISKEIVNFFNSNERLNSDDHMVARVEEIKGAIIYVATQFLKSGKSLVDNETYKDAIDRWIQLSDSVRNTINKITSHDDLNYILTLFDELKQKEVERYEGIIAEKKNQAIRSNVSEIALMHQDIYKRELEAKEKDRHIRELEAKEIKQDLEKNRNKLTLLERQVESGYSSQKNGAKYLTPLDIQIKKIRRLIKQQEENIGE